MATTSLRLMEDVATKDHDARRELVDDHHLIGDLNLQLREARTARQHYENALRIAQGLHAEIPRDLYILRQIADGHERIGRLHAAVASKREAAATRDESCREARASFQKSVDVWNAWGEKGGAASYREPRQRAIVASLPKCEE